MKILLFILLTLGVFVPKSSSDWKMYPNPARTYFNVEVKNGTLPAYVKVYDMQGRLMLKKFIGTDQMFARIEISFRPGKYIVYLDNQ
jgi:hypothetical protein